LALAVLVGAATGLLTLPIAAALAIAAALLLLVGARSSPRTAARASVAATLFVTLVFVATGAAAARQAAHIAQTNFGADRLIDHVLTAMPANPLCWDVLLLETRGDRYLVRHGILALAPALLPASACPNPMASTQTAPLVPVAAQNSDSIEWLGEFAMSRVVLAELISRHCDAAAFMLFARAPFVTTRPRNLLGDLRFDRGTGGGFEVGLGATKLESHCGRAAPWDAPRADLAPD
jgi:inner membrane protein